MTPETDIAARAELTRYRRLATALLLLMAGLTLGGLYLPPGFWADLLQASAKAGLVGGLADWFAVTALFRRPLGLPIPHTAIIPRQKVRLGEALGGFVANHVFTEADVGRTLDRLDLPGLLRGVLEDPDTGGQAAAALAGWLPRLLATIEDGRARRLLARLIPRLLGSAGTGLMVARALRGLVAGGRHQEVFGFVIDQLRAGLASREDGLRHTIEERVREQGGRLVGWAVGASVAKRVLHALNAEFEKMQPDGSDLRVAFDEWARAEIDRIEQDPQRAAEIGRAIRNVVTHDTVQAWIRDVWTRLREAVERDAADPYGRTPILLAGVLADFGRTLTDDAATRGRLDRALGGMIVRTLPAIRLQLADFIGRVVAGWDTGTITDRLELRVGKDLQYVRINGTVVGFLAGGALYVALWLVSPGAR